jgi:CRP-like cAMP-binding protein
MVKALLGKTGLFRGATRAQLAELAAHCSVREAARGEVVAARGKRLPGICAVAQGMLKLCLHHAPDDERVLRLVEPGQTFGEASALLDRPLRFDVCALTPAKLVVIPAESVYHLIEQDPVAARRTVHELAERCQMLLAELEAGTLPGARRLAAYLDSLARPDGVKNGWSAHLPATKTVVASLLDMKKETLSRLLRALADQGVIEVAQRDIAILDRRRLAALAESDASRPRT